MVDPGLHAVPEECADEILADPDPFLRCHLPEFPPTSALSHLRECGGIPDHGLNYINDRCGIGVGDSPTHEGRHTIALHRRGLVQELPLGTGANHHAGGGDLVQARMRMGTTMQTVSHASSRSTFRP
jgi:hypothetical protein